MGFGGGFGRGLEALEACFSLEAKRKPQGSQQGLDFEASGLDFEGFLGVPGVSFWGVYVCVCEPCGICIMGV